MPEGWAWTRLKDIAFITKLAGFEYSKYIEPNLCENGIPLFKGKNVQNSEIIYEFEGYIPEEVSDSLLRSQINKKCILTPYVGTIGNIGIHDKAGKFHLGSNVGKIELLYSELTSEEFVVHYLKSSEGYKQLTKHMKATAQESISMEALRDVLLPLPPKEEQDSIEQKLNNIFDIIRNVEINRNDLDFYIKTAKSKILDIAIHGKLVPQDPNDEPAEELLKRIATSDNRPYEKVAEEPFEIPDSWRWVKLTSICNKLVDGDHNPPKGVEEETEYIMASSRNINYDKLDDLENVRYLSKEVFEIENNRTKAKKGDIFFTSVGTIGRSCIYSGDYNICFQRSVTVLNTNINNQFLKYFFDSNFFQTYVIEHSTGTAQMGFYLKEMANSPIAIPPMNEQARIVDKVSELFYQLDQIQNNLI